MKYIEYIPFEAFSWFLEGGTSEKHPILVNMFDHLTLSYIGTYFKGYRHGLYSHILDSNLCHKNLLENVYLFKKAYWDLL